ncbi:MULTISPECIES: DNA-methyltransferase [Halorussus]|uniref:Type II methyltransferase n=2 Tax=Halorussus TaxID=1070314 RepID=A0A8U0HV12_9EURY|nr:MULTISPECIES: site-specific DNA-methyltransferase [Halorussus]UPV74581.1 site-specific DNA-methyltransferase [Halorussus limi]
MDGNTEITSLLPDSEAYYETSDGAAFQGDSKELLDELPENSIDLVVTSPPFGLRKKKEYGNEDPEDYNEWFMEFVDKVYRVLTEDGSFVVDIGGGWEKGKPVRSLYHFELLTQIAGDEGPFNLAQDFYWYNPAKLPTPAQWVTIERIRVKDAVNHVWWFSKSERPEADNRRVLKEYSDSQKKLMDEGYRDKKRPSGHDISDTFDDPEDADGAIRPNFWDSVNSSDYAPEFVEILEDADISQELIDVAAENDVLDELVESILSQYVDDNVLELANTASNTHYLNACKETGLDPHPARFPRQLPEFFIKFLTQPDDTVLDIFAGSNMTGRVAQDLERKWLAFEYQKKYLRTSKLRFMKMEEITKPDAQQDWDEVVELMD